MDDQGNSLCDIVMTVRCFPMALVEVTEKALFRAIQDSVRAESDFLLYRSDSLDQGPFLLKSSDGAEVIFKGVNLEDMAYICGFDITPFKVVRLRWITSHKIKPSRVPASSGVALSAPAANQRVPV